MALNQVSVVPAGVLRVISDGFLSPTRAFSKRAPHHFPKAHALRYGHRKFGDDRIYIRGEWALRRWHWIKFQHYGWRAKGDFIRYSYMYPYIFESRTDTFFESTCPELYAQQSWEWSDAYSWRNDLWKVNFKRVCKKPAGVLMVIWSGFLAHMRALSKGAPHHFQKAHALRYRHRKFGNDRMYIRGEWALRRWRWIKFQWYRLGCYGWFQVDFWPQPVHFRSPPYFQKAHALSYGHRKFGDDRMYVRGEWDLRRWHWIKFQWYRLGC